MEESINKNSLTSQSLKGCWDLLNIGGPHFENCCSRWIFDGGKAHLLKKLILMFVQAGVWEEELFHFVSPLSVGGQWFCHRALLSTCRDCGVCPNFFWWLSLVVANRTGSRAYVVRKQLSREFWCVFPIKNHRPALTLFPVQMRNWGPKFKVTWWPWALVGRDTILGNPIFFFLWPRTGCHPLS